MTSSFPIITSDASVMGKPRRMRIESTAALSGRECKRMSLRLSTLLFTLLPLVHGLPIASIPNNLAFPFLPNILQPLLLFLVVIGSNRYDVKEGSSDQRLFRIDTGRAVCGQIEAGEEGGKKRDTGGLERTLL
nr:hypothetical protein L203_04616 [Cryptococcus depauperatus CBS 7841]